MRVRVRVCTLAMRHEKIESIAGVRWIVGLLDPV